MLSPLFLGPFVVTEVVTPVLYRIADQKGSIIIHHNNIKMCRDRRPPRWAVKRSAQILQGDAASDEMSGDYGLASVFGGDRRPSIPTDVLPDMAREKPVLPQADPGEAAVEDVRSRAGRRIKPRRDPSYVYS